MRELAAALADYQEADRRAAGLGAGPGPQPPAAGPSLALRVVGTPFVYRPAPGQESITVGRQRRSPGDPPDHGNDFVLRVAGSDAATVRISRRHFEVRRCGAGFTVTDLSKTGLALNGRPLPKNTAAPLAAGDQLCVAGVVTLEVLFQQELAGIVSAIAQAPAGGAGGRLELEASLGDIVTVE